LQIAQGQNTDEEPTRQCDLSAQIYADLEEKSMREQSEISPAITALLRPTQKANDAQNQAERGIELLWLTSQNREQQRRRWGAAISWKTSFMIILIRRQQRSWSAITEELHTRKTEVEEHSGFHPMSTKKGGPVGLLPKDPWFQGL
jgi:hypothetical protein